MIDIAGSSVGHYFGCNCMSVLTGTNFLSIVLFLLLFGGM